MINFVVQGKSFCKEQWRQLLLTSVIFGVFPLAIRHKFVQHFRHNFKTVSDARSLLDKHHELILRVRVLGVTQEKVEIKRPVKTFEDFEGGNSEFETHQVIECLHQPYFHRGEASGSTDLTDRSASSSIIKLKLSGVRYPLLERTEKELRFKKLSGKTWFLHLNQFENRIADSSFCLHGWL